MWSGMLMFSILVCHQHCEPLCTTQSALLSFNKYIIIHEITAILLLKLGKDTASAILVAAVAHRRFCRIRRQHGRSKYAPCLKTEAQQWLRKGSFF
jgi:hypothetical protein